MEDNRIIECIERAHYILSNLMAVKPGEEVLIAIDPQTDMRMANAMAAAALMCGAEYNVSMMPIRGKDKATIFPKTLELAMEASIYTRSVFVSPDPLPINSRSPAFAAIISVSPITYAQKPRWIRRI